MKQKIALGIITVLIILVVGNAVLNKSTKTGITDDGTGIEQGDTPPQFTLETLSGDQVKLEDLKGKKVILNFWASWCQPCRQEMPVFQAYSKQNSDVVVLAVNMTHKDSSLEKIKAFIKDNGLTFTVALDSEGDVSKAYNVLNIPSTYFIDEQGIIQHRVEGEVDAQKIAHYMEQM